MTDQSWWGKVINEGPWKELGQWLNFKVQAVQFVKPNLPTAADLQEGFSSQPPRHLYFNVWKPTVWSQTRGVIKFNVIYYGLPVTRQYISFCVAKIHLKNGLDINSQVNNCWAWLVLVIYGVTHWDYLAIELPAFTLWTGNGAINIISTSKL